ncbi:MAG: fumarate hydratase, partial [Clostridia bacterium]|nr:fumarate hydratase [Clostridia bacterium]
MRKIDASIVKETVKKLFLDCNFYIGDDIKKALENAMEKETSQTAKNVLSQILENDAIAAKEEIPICQDTCMAVLFVEYGDKVVIENGSFENAVNDGVREAYRDGFLRKSIVSDPVFERKNTLDNTPAVIHTKIIEGE